MMIVYAQYILKVYPLDIQSLKSCKKWINSKKYFLKNSSCNYIENQLKSVRVNMVDKDEEDKTQGQ